MTTVSLKEALSRLAELLKLLKSGETVVIMEGNQTLAELVPKAAPSSEPRVPGQLKGSVLYMAPDFDAPLDDFEEQSP